MGKEECRQEINCRLRRTSEEARRQRTSLAEQTVRGSELVSLIQSVRRFVATIRVTYGIQKHFRQLRKLPVRKVEAAFLAIGLSEKSTCVLVSAIFGGIGVVSKDEFTMAFEEIGKLKA
jgi:hypothetical protein